MFFLKLCYWDSATTARFMDYILKIKKRKKKVGGLGRTRSLIFCFAKFLDPYRVSTPFGYFVRTCFKISQKVLRVLHVFIHSPASCPPVAGHSGFQVLPVSEVATKIS